MAWLVAIDGDMAGRRFALDAPCLVGRGPYNHVVLDDTRISRQHAKISPEAGGHVVYDLNSANGTYVNDVQVKRQKLVPDDVVRFGPFSFKFEMRPQLEKTGPARIPEARKFVEVATLVGQEPPVKIIESLEVTSTNPKIAPGLAELEEADRKLHTLFGFLQAVSTSLDIGELLDRIARNLLDIFPDAETVAIYLRGSSGTMEPRKVMRRDSGPASASTLPTQFFEEVVVKGRATLSTTISGLHRRNPRGGLSMHAPMIVREVTSGVLHVRGPEGATPFTQGDLDILSGLATQAAMVLANARMHQDSLKQQRLQQDLLLAEQIQKSFLPRNLPAVEGIEFVTEYRPAFSVGGDFYDVFWISYDTIGIFIGDVSGKGVSAALLMARISSDLRLAAAAVNQPARALEHVNRIVLERKQHDIFITCVYLVLNIKTHEVLMANAGHLPPVIRRRARGVVQRVEGGAGTAIGIFDDAEYDQIAFKLEAGDSVILCTDGVLEAIDGKGEQFGFDRFEAAVAQGHSRSDEVAERIQRALKTHVAEAPQYDDLTLIVCGIAEGASPERKKRLDEPTQNIKTGA